MSLTEQEIRSKCPLGINKCKECPRLMDNCDGDEGYWEGDEDEV